MVVSRAWVRRLAAGATLSILSLVASEVQAVYQCGGQTDDCPCNDSNPYPCCDNGGGNFGNCTWWGWHSACCNWGYGLPGWGNAKTWASEANLHQDFSVLSSPVVGSIACRDIGTYGHVAWVTAVNGSDITVTEMNCCSGCNNGMRTYNYTASYFTGGFIINNTQCQCQNGDTQSQSCGNCGQQDRACGNDCQWGNWSACAGEGVCGEGDTGSEACGDCGERSRSCTSSCEWDGWSDCDGPDPGGGTLACDTGQPGDCADGFERCVEGTVECQSEQASEPEICDGEDNNCDGQTDEDGVCGSSGVGGGTTSSGSGGYGAGLPGAGGDEGVPAVNDGLVGACDCRGVPGSGHSRWGWLGAALGLLWLQRRRR
jgi:surface antigen